MATTVISGLFGTVTIPAAAGAQNIQFSQWTARLTRDIHDVTPFIITGTESQVDNAREKIGGLMHLVGSATGFLMVSSTSGGAPTLGTAPNALDSAKGTPLAGFFLHSHRPSLANYKFTGIIGEIAPTVDRQGNAGVSVSFESSGAIEVDGSL